MTNAQKYLQDLEQIEKYLFIISTEVLNVGNNLYTQDAQKYMQNCSMKLVTVCTEIAQYRQAVEERKGRY